eukprot:TRINITY_DN54677_c0_g1_i1.p1 TRINITY_DN54677_c0_g1~~TRINITY_DN54677_c0_g1_i1.p1  ORF type:complete len:125 (+),score=19.93 TRINITY_DN54677_c0_g1_i1:144-518(+)
MFAAAGVLGRRVAARLPSGLSATKGVPITPSRASWVTPSYAPSLGFQGPNATSGAIGCQMNGSSLMQVRWRTDRGGKMKTKMRRMQRQQKRKERDEDKRAAQAHRMPQERTILRSAPPAPPPRP